MTKRRKLIAVWLRDDSGQDLVEWALLLAFVVCGSAAIFATSWGSIDAIWQTANNNLSEAASAVMK